MADTQVDSGSDISAKDLKEKKLTEETENGKDTATNGKVSAIAARTRRTASPRWTTKTKRWTRKTRRTTEKVTRTTKRTTRTRQREGRRERRTTMTRTTTRTTLKLRSRKPTTTIDVFWPRPHPAEPLPGSSPLTSAFKRHRWRPKKTHVHTHVPEAVVSMATQKLSFSSTAGEFVCIFIYILYFCTYCQEGEGSGGGGGANDLGASVSLMKYFPRLTASRSQILGAFQ